MTQNSDRPFLPLWMWGIVAIEVGVPTFFGIASTLDPSIWGAETLGALGQLYVTRNLAMALGVLVAAVLLRSYAALMIAIAARYVTDLTDIIAGIVRGAQGEELFVLSVFAIILLVLPAFGLRWLWKNQIEMPDAHPSRA